MKLICHIRTQVQFYFVLLVIIGVHIGRERARVLCEENPEEERKEWHWCCCLNICEIL